MKKRLLFLGPPGAGKGTQAQVLCENHGLLHLSTGDLLRSEVASETSLGKKAAALMNKGELVSDELVLSIVEKKLIEQKGGWLLDGFPRNVDQANSLDILLRKINQPIELVVLLKIADELLIQRLLSRGREDDSESVIRHRLKVYQDKTAPLVDHYLSQGLLEAVKATGNIEEIADRIEQIIS